VKIKIVTPISNLFLKKNLLNKIIKSSDYLELRHYNINEINHNKVLFFHSDLQLNFKFKKKDFEYLKKIFNTYKNIRYISFHLASCYSNPKLNNLNIFEIGNKKANSQEMINNALYNVKKIKSFFPKIQISVENNNYYDTGAYEFVCDPEFISNIVNKTGISFLFDYSHALISSYNLNIKFDSYIDKLPMNKINQIHLSRPIMKNTFYSDEHLLPMIDDFTKKLISSRNIRYITVEYYKNIDKLVEINNKIKNL
jgi:uncharacterized protein (UPF0276 family)